MHFSRPIYFFKILIVFSFFTFEKKYTFIHTLLNIIGENIEGAGGIIIIVTDGWLGGLYTEELRKGLGVLSIKCPKVDHRVLLINSDNPRVHTQSPKYWDIMGGGNQRDTKNLYGSNPEYIYF